MSEKPILFSAPMVRALLDGRKTMTRRAITSARTIWTPSSLPYTLRGEALQRALLDAGDFSNVDSNCWRWTGKAFDYQKQDRTTWIAHLGHAVGDHLWVREAHALVGTADPHWVLYRASGYDAECKRHGFDEPYPPETVVKWRPSIHMPRWASRITLEVTAVKVERLQDISENDAWAEGCKKGIPTDNGGFFPAEESDPSGKGDRGWDCARDWYADLWDEINGPGAWDANPWIVAYSLGGG